MVVWLIDTQLPVPERSALVNMNACTKRTKRLRLVRLVIFIYAPEGGVPTRHTHTQSDGLHTRHLLESTHTNTHKHKQTHSATICT